MAKAQLIITDETRSADRAPYSLTADELGRFKINGYSGQKLHIFATGFDPLERPESLRITLERPTHTVRIVIHKTSLRD